MKRTFIALMLALHAAAAGAHSGSSRDHDVSELAQEVKALRQQVSRLESLVDKLSILAAAGHIVKTDGAVPKTWGCFMSDMRAGGIYGTGATEAEAKGKAMEHCAEKDGVCWESRLECKPSH